MAFKGILCGCFALSRRRGGVPPEYPQTRQAEVFAVCNVSKQELLWIDNDDGAPCTRRDKGETIDFIQTRRTGRGRADPGYLYGMPSARGLSSSRAQVGGVEYNSFFVNPLAEGSHDDGEPIPYAGAALGTTNALLGILCKGHNNPLADEYSELSYSSTPESSPTKVRIRAFAPRDSDSGCGCALDSNDSGKYGVDIDSVRPASPGTPLLGPKAPGTAVLGCSSAASERPGSLPLPGTCGPHLRQPYAPDGKHLSEGPGSGTSCKLGEESSGECGHALQGVEKGDRAAAEGFVAASNGRCEMVAVESSCCGDGSSGKSIDNDAVREQHDSDIEEPGVSDDISGGHAPVEASAGHALAAPDVCAPRTPPLAARDGGGGFIAAAGALTSGPGRLGDRQAISDCGNGDEKRLSKAPEFRSATSVPAPQRVPGSVQAERSWRCLGASPPARQAQSVPELVVVDVSPVLPRGADAEAQMPASQPEMAFIDAQSTVAEAAQLAQEVEVQLQVLQQQQQQPSSQQQQLPNMDPTVACGVAVPSVEAALPSRHTDVEPRMETAAQPSDDAVQAPSQAAAKQQQQQASALGLPQPVGTIFKPCTLPELPEHFPSYYDGSQQLPSPPVLSPPTTVMVTVDGEAVVEDKAFAEPEAPKDLMPTGPAPSRSPPSEGPSLRQGSGGFCGGGASINLSVGSGAFATSTSLSSLPSVFLPSVPAALFSSPFGPPPDKNAGKDGSSSRGVAGEEPAAATTKVVSARGGGLTAAAPVCPVTPQVAEPIRAPPFPDPGCSISALAMTRLLIRKLGLLPLMEAPLLSAGGLSRQPPLGDCTTAAAPNAQDLPSPSPFAVAVSAAEAALCCTEATDANNEAVYGIATLRTQDGSFQPYDIIRLHGSECGGRCSEDVATARAINKPSHAAADAVAAATDTLEAVELWGPETTASAAAGSGGGYTDDMFSVMTTTQESSALFDDERGSCSVPCVLSTRSMQGWLEPQGWQPLRERYCGAQHQQTHRELQHADDDGCSLVIVM